MIKYTEKGGVQELTKIFCVMAFHEQTPEEWCINTTVPIFKGKGDALECGAYRGLRPLEH